MSRIQPCLTNFTIKLVWVSIISYPDYANNLLTGPTTYIFAPRNLFSTSIRVILTYNVIPLLKSPNGLPFLLRVIDNALIMEPYKALYYLVF